MLAEISVGNGKVPVKNHMDLPSLINSSRNEDLISESRDTCGLGDGRAYAHV